MMMRGRIPSPSDNDREFKRAKRDDDGSDPASSEHVQLLAKLVQERRARVTQFEEDARKIDLQLAEAQKKLADAEVQLAHAQVRSQSKSSVETTPLSSTASCKVKTEQDEDLPVRNGVESETAFPSKPPLLIPGTNGYSSQNAKVGPNLRAAGDLKKKTLGSRPSVTNAETDLGKQFQDTKMKAAQTETSDLSDKRPARKKPEPKEHTDLVSHIRESKAPGFLRMLQPNYIASQHKRKLRSLSVNPSSEQICATSALDGIINLWQIQSKGVGLSLLSSVDSLSPGQRRWPEDMAWHPLENCLFACYCADGNDNQVALISSSGKKAKFLEDKPHVKGILNSIAFMPWCDETYFVTGGSDHAVVMWGEKAGVGWKPKALHRNLHSSAVMGVAGLQHKQSVLSVGADKRVIGFDTRYQRADFRYVLESKAMGVLPNPADFNLFLVQTGTPGQQLRLFDIRVQRSELHAFGWIQETSDSQSALINQTWSPDGHYIASGSTDPRIHIFDIRYNSKEPSQSIKAHQKRVFKASWHHSLPLLISISSDLNIGLHRFSL